MIGRMASAGATFGHSGAGPGSVSAVGDTVPHPLVDGPAELANDYRQWREAFQAHTGRPLAFTVLDINWPRPKLDAKPAGDGGSLTPPPLAFSLSSTSINF